MSLKRVAPGEYGTHSNRYRVVRNWGDSSGWTVLAMSGDTAEVCDTWPLLRDARAQVEKFERADRDPWLGWRKAPS